MESHGVHYMQRTSDYATRTAASHGDPSSVNLVVWIRGTIRILRIVLRKSTKELEKRAIATKAAQLLVAAPAVNDAQAIIIALMEEYENVLNGDNLHRYFISTDSWIENSGNEDSADDENIYMHEQKSSSLGTKITKEADLGLKIGHSKALLKSEDVVANHSAIADLPSRSRRSRIPVLLAEAKRQFSLRYGKGIETEVERIYVLHGIFREDSTIGMVPLTFTEDGDQLPDSNSNLDEGNYSGVDNSVSLSISRELQDGIGQIVTQPLTTQEILTAPKDISNEQIIQLCAFHVMVLVHRTEKKPSRGTRG
ncbi:hypothetical protein VitviT2T_025384 [Vitis vinifera]|uniref:Uncharacterized protein n=1 Tax=Vitis vinifera TaxID=29760 RepID=A0ABY9DIL4_VITVI|nr:hypothetical protein VitviT2T_025384 [Vitis vinifera]